MAKRSSALQYLYNWLPSPIVLNQGEHLNKIRIEVSFANLPQDNSMRNLKTCRLNRHHQRLTHRLAFDCNSPEPVVLGIVRGVSLEKSRLIDPKIQYCVYYIDDGNEYFDNFLPCQVENLCSHPAIPATFSDLQRNVAGMQDRIRRARILYGHTDELVHLMRCNYEWFVADLLAIMLKNGIDPCFQQDFLLVQHALFDIE